MRTGLKILLAIVVGISQLACDQRVHAQSSVDRPADAPLPPKGGNQSPPPSRTTGAPFDSPSAGATSSLPSTGAPAVDLSQKSPVDSSEQKKDSKHETDQKSPPQSHATERKIAENKKTTSDNYETSKPESTKDSDNKVPESISTKSANEHSTSELVYSCAILIFGFLLIAMQFVLLMRQNRHWEILSFKVYGLTLVIVCGMFLIFAGYSDQQIGSMMGLLGTVAGYLLGREEGRTAASAPVQKEPPTAAA